jgi:PTS system nitrogen regulatory IIA component
MLQNVTVDILPQPPLDHAEDCIGLSAGSARAAHWALAKIAASRHPELSASRVYRALRRREGESNTAIGGGIAIPHARVEGIKRPEVVFAVLQDAIDCDSPDGQPVRMMALVVSDPRRPAEHLATLSRVAQMLIERSADPSQAAS